jgi:hypothetical protein
MFPSGASTRMNRSRVEENDEYIAEVKSSVAFATTQYAINPGQAATFPWLSTIAKNFEKYRILSLEFYYRPEVSAFNANGQIGKVMLSCDFDAADSPPTTKPQVEDTFPHADAMPYDTVRLPLPAGECNNELKMHFVRPAGLPRSTDVRVYDVGNFYVSTIACANDAVVIGELRVRYRVQLDVPILATALPGINTNRAVTWFQSTAREGVGATTTTHLMLLASELTAPGGVGAVNTAGSIVLPLGNYLLDFYVWMHNASADDTQMAVNINTDVAAPRSLFTVSPPFNTTIVTNGEYDDDVVTLCAFFASDGTANSALTFPVTLTYAAGAPTLFGTLRITLV